MKEWATPIDDLLRELLCRLQALFADVLVGVYLHGSLVAGDFDEKSSDVDLLVVGTSDTDEARLRDLERVHVEFVLCHPEWDDRLDLVYVSASALQTFEVRPSRVAVVSPGEPLHTTQTDELWVVKWYLVREQGIALFGPPPRALVGAVTREAFVASVRAHLRKWPEWLANSRQRKFHSYAVLTICRGLHTCTHGEQVSKRQAARWAAREHPEWSTVVRDALVWRDEGTGGDVDEGTHSRVLSWAHFAAQSARV